MIKHRDDNLTKEEEIDLGRQIQEMRNIKKEKGNNFYDLSESEQEIVSNGEEALLVLTGNYINLARHIAHRHHKRTGTRYSIEDLLQDAIGALIESANAYDPSKDCRLGTYAFYGITKRVSTTINYQRIVRMPENKMGEYILITRAQKAYGDLEKEKQDKYKSELDYVYQNVGKLKREEVDLILDNMQPQVSLNADIFDGEGQLMDLIKDEGAEIELRNVEALDVNLERIIAKLSPFQRDLIAFEYGVFPASMAYHDFLKKYKLTDRVAKRETRKVITVMINLAKKHNIKVELD